MKYSACTIAFRDRSIGETFSLLKECGYRYADIFTSHLPLSMPPSEVNDLLKLAQSCDISIVSLASGVGGDLGHSDQSKRKAAVEEINRCIDLAAQVGATVIRTGLGGPAQFDDRFERFVIPALLKSLDHAEKKNVRIGVENHSGGITQTVEGCRQLCDAVPSKYLGILYDPGNLLGLLQDYKRILDLMPDRIVHVHLKDGFPAKFNDQYAPQRLSCTAVGEGTLDIPFILEELKRIRYGGYVSVEYEAWHPEYNLPPVEKGLSDYLDYLNSLSV